MPSRQETATECVECRCTTAPAPARSRYIARCRKLSLVGASPATCLPVSSSFDSRAGSSAPSETLVGVISQPSSSLDADIAGAAEGQAALEHRAADGDQRLARVASLIAASRSPSGRSPRRRNCRISAPAQAAARRATASPGTPGSICGPMRSARTPSACTTAPEVSPPATTRRRTPAFTRPRASVGQRVLDQRAGALAAELRLHGLHLVRRRAGIDQDRARLQAWRRPGQRVGNRRLAALRQRQRIELQRRMRARACARPAPASPCEQQPDSTAAAPPTAGRVAFGRCASPAGRRGGNSPAGRSRRPSRR